MIQIRVVAITGLTLLVLLFGGYWVYKYAVSKRTLICSGSQPVFIPTNGGELLVGKISTRQTFQVGHILTLLNIPVSYCRTVSSITISPLTSYKIMLAPKWEVRVNDGEKKVIVIAPPIKPDLPVAFDTSLLKKAVSGCPLINTQSTLDDLEKNLSGELKKYAESQAYINKARNDGRVVVSDFVKKWLMTQKKYEHTLYYSIIVLFQGEPINYY